MSNSDSSEVLPFESNYQNEDSDSSLGLGDTSTSSSTEDERDLLDYDPTPWDNPFPRPYWFSCRQIMSREYGDNVKPGLLTKRPDLTHYNPYWFRKYAYDSLYFIQRMEMTDLLYRHTGCVNCLNFNKSGDLLCSGSDDLCINIWDWRSSKLKHSFSSGHTRNVFQSLWCLDDTHIVTCSRDGQIRICDINNISGSSKRIARHSDAVHKLTFTEPQVILSCGEDGAIYEIDLRCNKSTLLFVLKNQLDDPIPLYSINCNMNFTPNYFAVAGQSPQVRIYDRRLLRKPSVDDSSNSSSVSNDSSSSSDDHSNSDQASNPSAVMSLGASENSLYSVTSAVYNSTGSRLLMSYNDEDLYVFDTKTGKQEGKYQGHRNKETIKGCSWFGDNFIISGSDDGYIYGWDRKSQHIVMSIRADKSGSVNCLEMHPNVPVIASSGIEDSIKIFEPTADVWPKTLTGIKKRICENIRNRLSGDKNDLFDARGLAMLLVMRNMSRIRNPNQQENESDSQEDDDDDDSPDVSCLPS